MFNSLNSSRFNRTLRAAGLAVTIATLAAACGSTTDTPATQAAVALPGLTDVAESSPAPTDTTAPTAEVESETSGADNAPLAPVEQSPLQQPDLPTQPDPPTQPDTPAPDETTTPTPTDPTNVLEIPEGATVKVLGSSRLPGPNGGGTVFYGCTDSAGNTYDHNDIVTVDPYGPGVSTKWICDDGVWKKIGPGGNTPAPLENPPDERPEIDLDQADFDPPTDVFKAPVSN